MSRDIDAGLGVGWGDRALIFFDEKAVNYPPEFEVSAVEARRALFATRKYPSCLYLIGEGGDYKVEERFCERYQRGYFDRFYWQAGEGRAECAGYPVAYAELERPEGIGPDGSPSFAFAKNQLHIQYKVEHRGEYSRKDGGDKHFQRDGRAFKIKGKRGEKKERRNLDNRRHRR